MNNVYLSLGTNIGDREQNLKLAVQLLKNKSGITLTSVSSIYETAPVGYIEQPAFLNIALAIQTTHSALETLQICQSVENELGRVREIRWGPRIIDLDILLYNNDNIEVENLIVPHPRMFERAFVLVPLLEIAKSVKNPKLEKAKASLDSMDLAAEGITKWKTINDVETF
ncbi:2-amino-4-hydroxy-6-hydroxymethyldihydropteridine diphosphokinase [Ureibacillus chungkukjangi]|uniref:2-amino-4-hydroxy-6-hydroxymethyldihydropteridine diphosphokinase n=1 Tax=Ureibacillus chungkukjangi TaxID=1202712 RepID=A0A318TIH2_9BACL|nr:2-amino-4-hydroxy-6-hydroxymethyldihydropteridine diphosphokinase [Ureibacillus chungkukjangi]MCM3389804.1 2-amino-4-hydroxy-6-hydroxymethyldihydropteridine diphosphokinase [Ureibacillus chungkukjangi]PYF04662.1 2-amino-4-hydroxy-6-hydroxymethyldihydropteridine diphosphokinase [Ureibacillus chungkukjangi]HCG4536053.1 2-amino-4-hydroxy-6-hydroxymethyldihydropteridine diphosphokinase [Salmonella enterica subsp. enterica serovar Typhi str. AG3]